MKKILDRMSTKTKIIISALLMVLVISGVTYGAFYTTKNQEVTNDIVAGCFSMTFTEGTNGSINLTNALPMSDAEALQTLTPYTFTLANTCSVDSKYNIIVSVKDNSIDSKYIKIAHNEVEPRLLNELTANTSNIPSGYTDSYIITTGELNGYSSREFNIYLWLDEDTEYEDVSGKSFQAKVQVVNIATTEKNDMSLIAYEYNGENTQSSFDDYLSKLYSPNGYAATMACSEGTSARITKNKEIIWEKFQYPATCKIIFDDVAPNVDSSGANAPVLADNMIPVVWNGSTWIKAPETQVGWYDYSSQKWANAVTVTTSTRDYYKDLSAGEEVQMDDILGMWVWIPRYEYKYTEMSNYAGGTREQPGEIKIAFIEGTSTTESTGYIIHPAFRDASSAYTNNAYVATNTTPYQFGGWDKELTGFWYAKFEISGTTAAPKVKPDVSSLREQNVSTQFTGASNVASTHGIDTEYDSHMSRNSEWGAVAYLSQSKYGKYGNSNYIGANKEIYINNSSGFYTGRSMGMPAGATGNNKSENGSYKYNDVSASDGTYTANSGTGASTTGNIYGVYDMVGGAWEYQLGYLTGYLRSSGFTSAPADHKYYEEYATTTASTACGGSVCYGQGLSETASWYNDWTTMIDTTNSWFLRGSNYNYSNAIYSGVFGFTSNSGTKVDHYSFRAALSEK